MARLHFVLLILLTMTHIDAIAQEKARPVLLPGARSVIDARYYESIQAAIDACPPEGGMVQLPPGLFEITEPLRISKSDVTLAGVGAATHIKNMNTEGQSALILQHPTREENRQAELWRIRLADLRLTGNAKSGHGIEARRINEIFIDGVTVSEHGGDGIHLYYCYEDPRICDSLITYNRKTGLFLKGCHDIVVSANQFEENTDGLRCLDGFNFCMTGNNLDDHLGDGMVIENTYGSVVAGNMIEECKGTAIVLDRDCYGIALSANVIAHEESGGIDLRGAHGCTVSANVFTIVKQRALVIGPNSGRITVTGNNFSNSFIGQGQVKRRADDLAAAGILLQGTQDIAVTGNLFAGLSTAALALGENKSQRIVFSDNVITDLEQDTQKLKNALEHSLVENNLAP
ncbi:MAG: right-handed parallel beta-helix repeat-containing protein [Planctomycetes bacterium]|nr:right-handed parallel beta-helix repeat-containing protein [Planctomycetota bacterium]